MEPKRPFSDLDWALTPPAVKQYIEYLENTITSLVLKVEQLENRTNQLETTINKNSQNSSKPPSSDGPYKKPKKDTAKKRKRKKGAKKGHKGHKQTLLKPTKTTLVFPDRCSCGNQDFDEKSMEPFHTHQNIELPEIEMDITHHILHQCKCGQCGKTVKAKLPKENQPGYGPRLSALIAELSGIEGSSRRMVQDFCQSVLGFHISIGAIQNVIDRVSASLEPVYNHFGRVARTQTVNFIDETSWREIGLLRWLWVMASKTVSFYKIHNHRSKEAFLELVDTWKGILVSDGYGLYTTWVNLRQTCLAHYIRKARGLSESGDESTHRFGECILKELQLLCHWAKAPPSDKKWTDFYSRFIFLLFLHKDGDDESGKLSRSLIREMDSLWVFLEEKGVEPTNNRAERALRFGVIWRKRSYGTQSEKGNRWVERILSLKETCRLQSKPSFPLLVGIIDNYFKDQNPDLSWIGAVD